MSDMNASNLKSRVEQHKNAEMRARHRSREMRHRNRNREESDFFEWDKEEVEEWQREPSLCTESWRDADLVVPTVRDVHALRHDQARNEKKGQPPPPRIEHLFIQDATDFIS
jgi:hypothetical protein